MKSAGSMGSRGLCGIYIHVPFCIRKCPYCDFYSITDHSLTSAFVEAVIREITMTAPPPAAADTVFFGGGTPSILEAGQIAAILKAVYGRFDMAEDVEISLEANPGTMDAGALRLLRAAGVNRINIGAQSFDDGSLAFLGRIHTADDGRRAFAAARAAGFDNTGLDLIFGLPGQTPARWRQDLDAAVGLRPDHLSCYQLTFETGTRMAADLAANKFKAPSEKAAAEMFEQTGRILASAGYARYEISNFAISSSTRCRHNLKYWTFAPYLGFGPSAHSFSGCRRYWNVRDVGEYLARINSGRLPVEGEEALDGPRLMTEAVYLGLRLTDGIGISEFEDRFEIDFSALFGDAAAPLISKGLVMIENGRIRLTPGGMRLADGIAARFIEAIA